MIAQSNFCSLVGWRFMWHQKYNNIPTSHFMEIEVNVFMHFFVAEAMGSCHPHINISRIKWSGALGV